jgi:hypothetical protein
MPPPAGLAWAALAAGFEAALSRCFSAAPPAALPPALAAALCRVFRSASLSLLLLLLLLREGLRARFLAFLGLGLSPCCAAAAATALLSFSLATAFRCARFSADLLPLLEGLPPRCFLPFEAFILRALPPPAVRAVAHQCMLLLPPPPPPPLLRPRYLLPLLLRGPLLARSCQAACHKGGRGWGEGTLEMTHAAMRQRL